MPCAPGPCAARRLDRASPDRTACSPCPADVPPLRPGARLGRGAAPAALAEALEGFLHALRYESDRSVHTLRAYEGECASLLVHAARLGVREPAGLDLAVLRSWLARLRTGGAARTTLARRGSAARSFTAWAHRRGLLPADPGPALGTPKGHRPLPDVLRPDEAVRLLETVDGDDPAALRDRLALELLYATGVRVAELCGLDVDDVDPERAVVRVLGKGRKERTVPYGRPAQDALDAWLARGRPRLAAARLRRRAAARTPRRPGRPARRPHARPRTARRRARRPGPGSPRPAPHRGDPPARGRS